MLALTRKRGESIVIGDNVEVVILGIQGEQVKIGVLAPKSISVHRKEIYVQIQLENKEANIVNNIDLVSFKSILKNKEIKSEQREHRQEDNQ